MSRLDELIAEFCPDGVKYKRLGDLCSIKARIGWQRLTKSEYLTEGNYYLITGVDITSNNRVNFESCYYVSEERYHMDENIQLQNGDIIVTKDGTIGKVALIENMDKPGVLNSHLFVIRDKSGLLENKYLMYILLSNVFQKFVSINQTQGTIPGLNQATIVKFTFPVPPLPVQQEIVRILDHFTELTAELTTELTAELTARKKQYEYYRSALISNRKPEEYQQLRNVVKRSSSGGTPTKGVSEYYDNATIPWIRTQDVRFNEIYHVDSYITEFAVQKTSAKWIPENCVIVAISGASAGRCAINKIKATTNQHCLNLQIDEMKALYKYVYYCVCCQYEELLSKKQGARGDLNSSLILGISIPVPPLDEQERIVYLLDRFDTICNDLSSSLPVEIAARQKQYEYYRDKLLTFKELKKS